MTPSHKAILFGLVLARLAPYQKRMLPNHDLWIKYDSTGDVLDRIDISAHKWDYDTGNILDFKYFVYRLEARPKISVNTFIDNVIEELKPFYN